MQKERNGELLPRRLKAARVLAGLDIPDLAEKTGYSIDKLYRFERGQVPDAVELHTLAKALGQPVAYFLEEAA